MKRRSFQTIYPHRIFRPKLVPQIAWELVEHEHDGLPALRPIFRLGVVLVAANDEAVGEILEEFVNLKRNVPSPSRKTRFTENGLRERDGETSTKPSCLIAGLLEAACFWGGQTVARSTAKLSHHRKNIKIEMALWVCEDSLQFACCGPL
jgi:hypothetical protein